MDGRKFQIIKKRLLAEVCDGTPNTLQEFIGSGKQLDDFGLLYNALLFDNVDVAKYLLSAESKVDINNASCEHCLHLAVAIGEKDIIEMLLKKGASINAISGSKGSTALYDAVRYNNVEITELLLNHGAGANSADCNGVTPLHVAVEKGNREIVKLLLQSGASVYATTATDNAPLHIAVKRNRAGLAKLLVNEGAWVNARTIHKLTPLHLACESGCTEIVEFLLRNGAEINAETKNGWSPLHFAVENGRKEITELLLRNGADEDAITDVGCTPLHIAVEKTHDEIVELLLRSGASVNAVSYFYGTPLCVAVENGSTNIVALLITYGATCFSVPAFRWNSYNPLLIAVVKGIIEIVDLLLNNGPSDNECKPLWVAAKKGSKEIVEFLIDSGACVNDGIGYRAPLSAAAKMGRKEIIELLLNRGACVNAGTKCEPTPLHFAVEIECRDTVELLLRHGADVNAGTPDNQTPLYVACKGNSRKIVEMLLSLGASVNAASKEYGTPLHAAAAKGNEELVSLLLSRGASVNAESETLGTPLHAAAAKGSENAIRLLLSRGAMVNAESGKYGTPLHAAAMCNKYLEHVFSCGRIDRDIETYAENCNTNAVELLLRNGACVKVKSVGLGYPVQVAAYGGHYKTVDVLLQHGADVDAVNVEYGNDTPGYYRGTALRVAVMQGQTNVVRTLLSHNPDVNNENNMEALSIAVQKYTPEYNETIDSLLAYGFALKLEDARNPDILRLAFRNRRVKLVEEMFKTSFKENEKALSTMVCDAVELGGFEVIATLLKLGVDANKGDVNGMTALHYVAGSKRGNSSRETASQTILWLLNRGAKVSARDKGGRTPLHTAAQSGFTEAIEILLDNGADINDVENEGYTALSLVLRSFYILTDSDVIQTVKFLLSRGANVNSKSKKGLTPLHNSSYCSSVLELLLQNGADVNAVDTRGYTALYVTAFNTSLPMDSVYYKTLINSSKILLSRGANVNTKAVDGTTCLHIACQYGNVELVALLIEHSLRLPAACCSRGGTSASSERLNLTINATTVEGKTPLHYAAEITLVKYEEDIVFPHYSADIYEVNNMLLRKGAIINAVTNEELTTALHIAVKSQDEKLVPLYLRYGANVNAKNKHGDTPLHIASQYDKETFVEALLEYGADVNLTNEHGATPLDCAKVGGLQITTDSSYIKSAEAFLCLVKHIVKIKSAGMYVRKSNLAYLKPQISELYHAWYYSSQPEFPVFESHCEKEIFILKTESIGNSDWSYYDILTAGMSRLIMLTRDQNVVASANSDYFRSKFPVYSNLIIGNLTRGKERGDLLEKSTKIVQVIYSERSLPDICIDNIVSYLCNADLRMLVNAYYPRKCHGENC